MRVSSQKASLKLALMGQTSALWELDGTSWLYLASIHLSSLQITLLKRFASSSAASINVSGNHTISYRIGRWELIAKFRAVRRLITCNMTSVWWNVDRAGSVRPAGPRWTRPKPPLRSQRSILSTGTQYSTRPCPLRPGIHRMYWQ